MPDEAHDHPEPEASAPMDPDGTNLERTNLERTDLETKPPLESMPQDAPDDLTEPAFDSITGELIIAHAPILAVPQVDLAVLEGLSNQLVWKIGKEEGSERVVVRVGYASATGSFRELPKLRGATDPEVAEAAKLGDLVVEWIE
jgi:hypothetical protein